jgi:biopolymer transport protein ExbD
MYEAKNYPSALITVVATAAFAAAVCGVIWAFYGPPWSAEVEAFEPVETGDVIVDFAGVKVVMVPSSAGEPFAAESLSFALANEKFVFEDGRAFDCEPISERLRVWPEEPDNALADVVKNYTSANLYVGDSTRFIAVSYCLVKLHNAGVENVNLILTDDSDGKLVWPVDLTWSEDPIAAPVCYVSPRGYSYAPVGGVPVQLSPKKGVTYKAAELAGFMEGVYTGADVPYAVLCPDWTTPFSDIVPFFDAARTAGFKTVYLAYDPADPFTAAKVAEFGGGLFYPEVSLLHDGPILLK